MLIDKVSEYCEEIFNIYKIQQSATLPFWTSHFVFDQCRPVCDPSRRIDGCGKRRGIYPQPEQVPRDNYYNF